MKRLLSLGFLALSMSAALADTAPAPAMVDPTNSANNRIADVTAADQSNAPRDLRITAAIRRRLVQDARLSVDAKNVKVITCDGKVFLRGPVDSAREKKIVWRHAARVAGRVRVDNQLTVK